VACRDCALVRVEQRPDFTDLRFGELPNHHSSVAGQASREMPVRAWWEECANRAREGAPVAKGWPQFAFRIKGPVCPCFCGAAVPRGEIRLLRILKFVQPVLRILSIPVVVQLGPHDVGRRRGAAWPRGWRRRRSDPPRRRSKRSSPKVVSAVRHQRRPRVAGGV
jgi:hypothetical protein